MTNTYRLGWDERNGGNISYLLDESLIAPYLDPGSVQRRLPQAPKLDCVSIDELPYLEESGSVMELPEKLAVTVKHKRILFLCQPAKKRA